MGDYKYIDISYLIDTADGDTELMKEMVRIFFHQVDESAKSLPDLNSEKKYTELGKAAHKAKSSVAIVGMQDLAQDLKYLENKASQSEDADTYPVIIRRFIEEVAEAKKELNDFIEQL